MTTSPQKGSITDLGDGFTVVKPIPVVLDDEGDDEWGAYWEEVSLYGEGLTKEAAIEALKAEIIQAHRDLRMAYEKRSPLAGYCVELSRLLTAHVLPRTW